MQKLWGLTEGIHYEVQARLRDELGRPLKNDETGKEMQPDVILHYPQGQDAIVDSKVSLVAYEKYVNAETPEEKERYLQDHIKSVRQHVLHLVLDLRLDIIEKKMKEIQQQLRQVGGDMARARQLLEQYKDTQELRDALAKQLGNDLVR